VSYTKRYVVTEAYAELALAGYVFDLTPDELLWASGRLDMLMGTWLESGIDLGYPVPTGPALDLDEGTNLEPWAIEPAMLALAVRIAAAKGKQLAPSTLAAAKSAYDRMAVRFALPDVAVPYQDTLPVGAGDKPWRSR
jgi:hypothetical protein